MTKPEEQVQTTEEAILEEPQAEVKAIDGVGSTFDGQIVTELEGSVESSEAAELPVNLEEELELTRQEAAQNKDNWQRAVAEFANYKRRQEEQHKLLRDRIKSEVLVGVISALDDMELAFQNVPAELDGQLIGWVEGFRLVNRKLDKIIEDQNVMPINTAGEFDPNIHEAVSYEESEDHGEGKIIAELRKGYQIGSRVIRPALVRVAK